MLFGLKFEDVILCNDPVKDAKRVNFIEEVLFSVFGWIVLRCGGISAIIWA